MRTVVRLALSCVVLAMAAWNAPGHRAITDVALTLLPAEAPAWLLTPDTRAEIAYQSNEPDRWRGTAIPALSHENGPDHFMDLELLERSGLTLRTLPPLRYDFVAAIAKARAARPEAEAGERRGVASAGEDQEGYLPYAIMEHYAKLVSSFNTLRILERLDDPARAAQLRAARANVIHEMGQLSHFVGDAGQPLHTTIHHHGWVGENPDGFTTERSFHAHIDGGVVAMHGLDAAALARSAPAMRPIAAAAVWDETLALIERSHAAVRPLYELQKSGALHQAPGAAFISERMNDAASVLAGLYWRAWEASAPTEKQVKDFVRYDGDADAGKPAQGSAPAAAAPGRTPAGAAAPADAPNPAGAAAPAAPAAPGTPGAPGTLRAAADTRPAALPAAVDLRPELARMGLGPRPQGARGTCSIFTTCAALEFALAKARGRAERMSPEYLNWAAAKALGRPSDGNFFHNALAGFAADGVCAEARMPYATAYDAARQPDAAALAEAGAVRALASRALAVHWIVPWTPDRFGVSDAQFEEIRRVLARGYPVAAGSGHSRLLVGYRDNPLAPGGGVFLTQDSALDRFDEVTYEFVRREVADAFWVEAVAGGAPGTQVP
jgi:hypothetical protein